MGGLHVEKGGENGNVDFCTIKAFQGAEGLAGLLLNCNVGKDNRKFQN